MTSRPSSWLGLVAALGLAAAPTRPQAAPPTAAQATPAQTAPAQPADQPVFRAGVKLVLVDVTVTGNDDQPLMDLAPSDFELTEDGVPQTVEQATLVRLDGAARGDKEALEIRSRDHAIAEAGRDDVRLFAVFMDDYHLGRYPQEMIPLRKALTDFLGGMMGPLDLVTVMNPITPLSALEWTRDRQQLVQGIKTYEGRNDNFIGRSALEESQNLSRNAARVRSQVVITALQALVMHLSGLREGRKTILFVSQGIPLQFDVSLEPDFQDVLRDANRGNVVIHTMDPRGLGLGPSVHSTLYRLSAETGGHAIVNTNDLTRGLEKVVRDASHYYLLGYAPTRELNDGKFHKIAVKVKRKGAKTVARRGYYAPSADEMTPVARPELEPAVSTALTTLQARREDRVVHVETGFAPGTDGRVRLTATWRPVPGFRDKPQRLTVEVRDAAAAPPVAGDSPIGANGSGVLTLDVPPGEALVRFTAFGAGNDVVDRWEAPLVVPDLTGTSLAMGSPAFIRARTTAAFQALRRGEIGTPIPDREFTQSDLIVVRAAVAGGADAAVTAAVLTREGKPLATLPATAVNGQFQIDLPLRSLALGEYVLRFTAARNGASANATTGFAIVR